MYEEAARLQHQRRREQEQRAPADVIIPADIPAVPAGSEGQHFRRQSLLSRLLSMADTRPAVASRDSADARAASSRPFLVVDYSGKRSSFIGKPKVVGCDKRRKTGKGREGEGERTSFIGKSKVTL